MHPPRLKNSPMTRLPKLRAALAAALAIALMAAPALARQPRRRRRLLEPPGKKIYFGVSDTGDPASFGQFSTAVSHHPPVIESFRTWGSDFPDSIRRWQTARARPMIHIIAGRLHCFLAIEPGRRGRLEDATRSCHLHMNGPGH